MTKTEEALLYIASKIDCDTEFKVREILCDHDNVNQVTDNNCQCNNCLKIIPIDEYRERLLTTKGILFLLDGTREYRCRGV